MKGRKPRKTRLSLNDPLILSLKELILGQSKDTLLNWCLGYCEEELLPLYEREIPGDKKPQEALEAARAWQRGEIKLPAARKKILACHEAARRVQENPIAQAVARSIGQAASTIHAAGHSLAFVFYAVAAQSYDELGPCATEEAYDEKARAYGERILHALKRIAVEDEEHPARINWQ